MIIFDYNIDDTFRKVNVSFGRTWPNKMGPNSLYDNYHIIISHIEFAI